jgi:iron(III) transport system substrate-binding protein
MTKQPFPQVFLRKTAGTVLGAAFAALACSGAAFAQAKHQPADAGFESSYDAIVAAAEKEPALQFCQTFSDEEWEAFSAGFKAAYPNIKDIETSECNGTEPRERVIVEWKAGRTDVDVMNIGEDMEERLEREDIGSVPDWSVFDGSPLEIDKEDLAYGGRLVQVGSSTDAIVFNKTLVKREDVPKSFKECADPKYKGELIVDVRPGTRFALMPVFLGDDGVKEWAKAVAANEPLWARSSAPITTALLQGERPIACGVQIHGILRGFVKATPDGGIEENTDLDFVVPTDNSNSPGYFSPVIAKKPNAPNTALLLVAYAAANPAAMDEVNPGYGAPWVKGSWKSKYFEKTGVKWNVPPEGRAATAKYAERAAELILEAWGHPQPAVK